jgi:hypothetical protein
LIAIPEGGWDAMTCATARMNGFRTELRTDLVVDHLKPRNVSQGGVLRRKWQMGVRDYALGYHPVFEFVKCIGRMHEIPVLFGAASWWIGYCTAWITRRERAVPPKLLTFMRREQLSRLLPTRRILS